MLKIICEHLNYKTGKCSHKDVPKKFFRHQPCLEINNKHGICKLKETIFDMLKQPELDEEKPSVCGGCRFKLYSGECEKCDIRSWPNVPTPKPPSKRILWY